MYDQGFSFEQWVIVPSEGVVSGPHGETRLEPRVMDVLVQLASDAGQVVARNDLIDAVWGDAVVGDEVLSRCIYLVRQALGESSRSPRYIQTIPKRGYRLNASVTDLAEAEETERIGSWDRGSPFRGLQAFDVDHAPIFFGRARATREALNALRYQARSGKSFLLLLGHSGVGKSSLARAGLLHNLLQPGFLPEVHTWHHAVFRPGGGADGPVAALMLALKRALGRSPEDHLLTEAEPEKLVAALKGAVSDGHRVLLVVDQLEELFSNPEIGHEPPHEFFALLEALASCGHCWIVATLRSDFYAHCADHPALMRLKKGVGQYDVRPLQTHELRRSIVLPAAAAGLTFERDADSGQALDEVLFEAAVSRPRLLPLLEFTLQALFETRTETGLLTFAAYDGLGGIEGSLARRAESTYSALPSSQQATLPQVIARLVKIDEEQEIAASCALKAFPTDEARDLVKAFVDARLFSADLDAQGQPTVAVTHEALLTHWPRIRSWIGANREMIHVRQRVSRAGQRWEAERRARDLLLPRGKALDEAVALIDAPSIELNQNERRFINASRDRAQRRRWVERTAIAALLVLSIVAGGSAWQAAQQRDLAVEQRRIAEREGTAARETADFLVEIFESADPSESTGGQVTARRILDEGIERLESGSIRHGALRTRLRLAMASAYKGLGLYADAEAQLRLADEQAARSPDFGERERLEIRFQLADTLFQMGDLTAAEMIHGEVLERRRQQFGENDLDTVASLSARAHELWRNGDPRQARVLFEQVLSVREAQLGQRHRLVVDVLMVLGGLHYQQGLLDEAGRYYRAVAEQAPEAYGERHPRTAIALANLALVEADPVEREALLNRSLSIRREAFGDDHVLVARAEESLARFHADQGDDAQAESLYRQALDTLENVPTPTPVLPWTQNRYASFLEEAGRHAEAVDAYRASRDNFADLSGETHHWTLVVHGNLGYAHYLAGDSRTARRILEEAIDLARSSEVVNEVAVASLQRLLAVVITADGPAEEAVRLARAAVEVYGTDDEVHRSALRQSLGTLAAAQLEAGQAEGALVSVRRAVDLGAGSLPTGNNAFDALAGQVLAHTGDCQAALPVLDTAETGAMQASAPSVRRELIAARIRDGRALCRR